MPSNDYAAGLRLFRADLDRVAALSLQPPPDLTVSAWAASHAVLSPETSATTGRFQAFGYQNGIMDAISDPTVEEVVVMKSARVGYTKVLDNVVGFFIHHDPSPVLVVLPRVEDAEDYSRSEIAPMLRDTPVLAELTGDLKSRDSDQRLAKRMFRNGASVAFVGANSPGGFRRITARVVLFDEVDGYPTQGAGLEGDQIQLGRKRTESFWNRKVVMGSTPTVKGLSRIERAYEKTDKRVYHVPCPHCGECQPITWASIKYENNDPTTAHMVCAANGCVIDESSKPWMIEHGEWVATAPFNGIAGFHIWAGYSLFPNASWENIVREWLRVQGDPVQLQTFVNLVLGEPWEETQTKIEPHALQARAEGYEKPPADALLVTASADTQDDRLEATRVAWGVGEEAWVIEHAVLYGDPSGPDLWRDLEDWRNEPVITQDGRSLITSAMCIDTGGHHSLSASRFSLPQARRGSGRVYAIKGMGGEGKSAWPKRASRNNKARVNLFMVGVDTLKDMLFARLKMTEAGPGFIHFPSSLDSEYFRQLAAEKVATRFEKGFPRRIYVKDPSTRNEALDCMVYALAALVALNVNWRVVAARKGEAPREGRRTAPQRRPEARPVMHSPFLERYR